MILLNWKSSSPPRFKRWLNEMVFVSSMDQMRLSSGNVPNFNKLLWKNVEAVFDFTWWDLSVQEVGCHAIFVFSACIFSVLTKGWFSSQGFLFCLFCTVFLSLSHFFLSLSFSCMFVSLFSFLWLFYFFILLFFSTPWRFCGTENGGSFGYNLT